MTSPAPIPLVALDGDLDGVARAVRAACTTTGFLVIGGHGVAPELLAAMRAASYAFFDLPDAAKAACYLSTPMAARGYRPMGSENNARSLHGGGTADLKEYFTIGKPYGAEEPLAEHAVPNAWPAVDGFQAAWRRYFAAMEQLGDRLNTVFARSLAMPDAFFVERTRRHCSTLRAIHYPALEAVPEPGRLRSGEHTDFGGFTVLWSDAIAGLQIRDRNGAWVDVESPPDCFVVNIGDLLAQWTNDLYVSTLHRVVNGPGRRLSLVYFHHPDADTLVEAIPTCTGPDRPAQHAPVLAGDHRRRKVALATAQ